MFHSVVTTGVRIVHTTRRAPRLSVVRIRVLLCFRVIPLTCTLIYEPYIIMHVDGLSRKYD